MNGKTTAVDYCTWYLDSLYASTTLATIPQSVVEEDFLCYDEDSRRGFVDAKHNADWNCLFSNPDSWI